MTIVSLKC